VSGVTTSNHLGSRAPDEGSAAAEWTWEGGIEEFAALPDVLSA